MSDHTPKPAASKNIPFDRGAPYTCPELKRIAGLPDSRFEAFKLPSLMSGKLVYPKRVP